MHTYWGLLDDFALRHGDLAISSLGDLNEHLIAAALFGERLLINDGHVLVHYAVQQAVVNHEESPLRDLVASGYVKILTRNGGHLDALADEMAKRDITSARRMVADPWYAETYRPLLEQWSEQLGTQDRDGFMNWPRIRTDTVFKAVAEEAYTSLRLANPTHASELSRFRDQLDGTAARRTEWEDKANALLNAGQISKAVFRNLMFTANEAYQYAWGCALGSTGEPTSVLTRRPKHLDGFEARLGQVADTPRKSVNMFVPNLTFARKAIHNRWKLLAEMLSPGHEVNQLKQRFLGLLAKYYASDAPREGEVEAAVAEYSRALSRHFGKSETVPVVFDLGFVAASTAAGAIAEATAVGAAAGPIGMAVGFTVGVAGVAAAHLGGPQFFWRLTAPNPKHWVTRVPRAPVEDGVSRFQMAPEQVDKYTTGAAHFTQDV